MKLRLASSFQNSSLLFSALAVAAFAVAGCGASGLIELPDDASSSASPVDLLMPPPLTPDLLVATCSDHVKNGGETDVDCGGVDCPPCGDLHGCMQPRDCTSGVCGGGRCAIATCSDGVKNGSETDVDCGGNSCPACPIGGGCVVAGDCLGGVCMGGKCIGPTCNDGLQNGGESDVDCGGGVCVPCGDGKRCSKSKDCASGVCTSNRCAMPNCHDGVKNGDETDVDCGGASCIACGETKGCLIARDCASSACVNKQCATQASCYALLAASPKLPSGFYPIDPDGAGGNPPFTAYCDMSADGGGWTLALKINGQANTFVYAASVWTDATTFGAADLSAQEAKLLPFLSVPFTALRVVMRDGGADRALVLKPGPLPPNSTLHTVFVGGGFVPTGNTRPAWISLLASGSLQTHCGQEGLINRAPTKNVRIGIIGNQENDCNSCDSFIGLGGDTLSSGNIADGFWDDSGAGGRFTPTFSFVYLR